ncbi:maleylpyruvate isomerase N-terminal domain-containing protein [Rhodococcus sp. H29-C3]|uniref:maleylpyruvate isomerase N-terminal domain-containing protein n=1 Tax=Rhodococcus sp. H29-C3 TaxID=3046307 RepID=UPI0024BADA30|nr:maleylpyruvate isomerase N-terminal domain-containing protein [Rhodococcus sp. H29-C3]MDJ0363453.1 maleylpyruvate isomerase N-terminal domain-containing protein [Rhodococcus sp. H29-C3]
MNKQKHLAELNPADRHRAVATEFTEQVAAVSDWQAPTPVDGWVTRDIVDHLITWFTEFLSAGGQELPPGPDVGADPSAAWQAHVGAVQSLLDDSPPDTEFSHPMVGAHRLADAIDQFYTADVFMHTWDLVAANGHTPELDGGYAAQLLEGMSGIEDLMRLSGQFGPAFHVPDDADPVTRLVGFIGRDPKWSPAPSRSPR